MPALGADPTGVKRYPLSLSLVLMTQLSVNSHTIGVARFRLFTLGDPQQEAMSRLKGLKNGSFSSVERVYADFTGSE